MHLFSYILCFLFSLTLVLAAPHGYVKITKVSSERRVPNSFIVTLKPNANKTAHMEWAGRHAKHAHISHAGWDSNVFHGFAGHFSAEAIASLQGDPDVVSIEENARVHTFASYSTQWNATWGLNRISHKLAPKKGSSTSANYQYKFDTRAGQGVDIYILDTGINVAHKDFGGRAKWGAVFGNYSKTDGDGHGTHCAGVAVSNTFGVAKKATAIAVKVLADDGSGSLSDVISGINYVVQQAKATKRPSIINLSLGGDPSQALDDAVNSAISQGIHVAVAAGNDNVDAKNTSPARVSAAVTVGASDINDARAYFSNFGAAVDIFAPGLNIKSTWIGSPTTLHTMSGTSMATPHVAGLMAYFISINGKNMSPAALAGKLQSFAQAKKLSNIPSGTRNTLLYNNDGA